jgi:TDG/mug DNA glycosylase family protein
VDTHTAQIYEQHATAWSARRSPRWRPQAQAFAAAIAPGEVRVDLGCGPGQYGPDLGWPLVQLDVAFAMLAIARDANPDAPCVQADLEALPFRTGALHGGWSRNSYVHVPRVRLPIALAQLHRALAPGAPIALTMIEGDREGGLAGDDFPGRFFALWETEHLEHVVEGAGFTIDDSTVVKGTIHLRATRARTLPDFVGPGMSVLVCGLNPSLRAADVGFGYAGPSNRFWPAATDAGLVTRPRDPWAMLRHDRVGMTDLVKRATVGAKELRNVEYREGAVRVRRICEWLRPQVVCFVGLAGYRAGVDRHARPGVQPERFGGSTAYVLPSTSGLNATTSRADLTDHLRAVVDLGRSARRHHA